MISYLLLAAGSSSRFQSPKSLALIDKQYCINYLLNKIISCNVEEIIVVLGDHFDIVLPKIFKHNSIRIVHNKDHILGQTSSVITALKSTKPQSTAFALHPVDCPFVKTQTIDELIRNFSLKKPDILIPCHQSRKGHPPIFNSKIKDIIIGLGPDIGINKVFSTPEHRIDLMETHDAGVNQSFNTVDELNAILDTHRKSIT